MKIFNILTVGTLLGSSVLGSILGGANGSKVSQVKLLSEHGLGIVTSPGGYAAAHELKARDITAVSRGSLGLFGSLKEATQGVFGRHDGNDDGTNVLFGATSAIATVTIKEACGTMGSLTTSASPSGSYIYPQATTIKSCPPFSCYDGLVSQPTKATYVPATIELPGTPATPVTTKVPRSSFFNQTTVSSTATTTILIDTTTTISDGTPTTSGPTTPPTVSSPVTGAAAKKTIKLYYGAALGVLLL